MEKSLPMAQLQSSDHEYDPGGDQVYDQSIIIPNKFITSVESFEKKDHSWFVSSQIPTDLTIQIQDINFNVHKFPLASKCGYIGRLELQPSISNFGYDLKLENFPGGAETFESILQFCYGLPLDFNPNNIARLRCAAEFLEMTEEFDDGNLISKTEAFLTFVVLSSWKDTITVLKSCENLSPWAENLQIVRRCCDSIAWKASRESSPAGETVDEGWWIDDVTNFRIDHFMRIITSIRAKGAKQEVIGKSIMQYAERWLPVMSIELEGVGCGYGKHELQFSIFSGRNEEVAVGHNKEQRTIIESLVSLLPSQSDAVSCKFLLQMLRMGMMQSASPALISELEKRVGMLLEDANVNDLLIPNYKYKDQGKSTDSFEQCTMHNIDVVQRILEYFLIHEQQQPHQQQRSGKNNVSKLLDGYLVEIAKDPSLPITKFQVLAESLPANSRTCDDGLYRAIDTYLKTHPTLSEHDRRRVCKIMNCDKLSLDACKHAAQNDRLPVRTIIQVLFSEQVKMRTAIQGKEMSVPRGDSSEREENQSSTSTELKTLKAELETVKTKMTDLQNDYSELQHDYEKLSHKHRNKSLTGWSLGWKKIKNSLHTKAEEEEFKEAEQPQPHISQSGHSNRRTMFRRRQSVS